MAPRETENNAYAKFGVKDKEHYGMLWYYHSLKQKAVDKSLFTFLLRH